MNCRAPVTTTLDRTGKIAVTHPQKATTPEARTPRLGGSAFALRIGKVLFASYGATVASFGIAYVVLLGIEQQGVLEWLDKYFFSSTALVTLCWVPFMWRKLK